MKVKVDDGRNFASDLAISSGEAAGMQVDRSEQESSPQSAGAVHEPEASLDTYYEQPMLKASVWTWAIPAYFFLGGMSGAASMLAMAAQLLAPRRMPSLSKAAHLVATVGESVSAVLLIIDLGRPSRFFNMLRVFRPTSPMSIGTYVLSASGAGSAVALLLGNRNVLGKGAALVAGLLGGPLSGYTAVLLTNTAVPAWAGARKTLPVLFLASSAASAGSLLSLLPLDPESHRVACRFATFGKLAELGARLAVERELSQRPHSKKAWKEGVAGACLDFARGATLASLGLSLMRSRSLRRAGDVLALAGAVALRFGVTQAGKASARDPRAATEVS